MKTLIYVILACMTILAVLEVYILFKVFALEKKVHALDEMRVDENIALTKNIMEISNSVGELKEKLDKPAESSVQDSIEKQIDEAREKVFTEWIQNIVNYSPTGGK